MFYFSGTGNSKYISGLFCKYMDIDCHSCHSIEEDLDFSRIIGSEEILGFCYPVYGSRLPRIMREFAIRYTEVLKNKSIIIFCSQMIFSGDGARSFTDIFPKNHFNVIYAEHFFMPNNVNNLFFLSLPNQKKIKKYMTKADRKMKAVCQNIKNGIIRKRGFNAFSRALGHVQGSLMPLIEKKTLGAIRINNDCKHCLLCISICPIHNLVHEGGNIVQKNNCTICYRCMNKCPEKAISLYFKTRVKRQYHGISSD